MRVRYITRDASPTLYLRTRNVTSSRSACARTVSDVVSVRARSRISRALKPLLRPQRIVTMFIGCGLRERTAASRGSHPVHPKENILFYTLSLSSFLLLSLARTDALPIRASVGVSFLETVGVTRLALDGDLIPKFPPRQPDVGY